VEEDDNQSVLLDHLHHLSDDDDQLDDLFIVNDTGEKIGDEFVDWIIREAKEKGAGLVILDTLRSLHTAKENDSDSMQPIMDALRHITRENITTLFLHHNKKGQQGDKEANTMDLARGSGAVGGSVHGHITLSKKKDAEGLFLVLEQAKNKSVMELDPFTVRVKELTDPGEVIPSRLRFEYAGDHDAGKTARDALVVRLKRHFSEHKGEYFTRKNFVELKFAKGAADQTLRTALEHLIKKEQIISKKYADLFTSQKTAVQEKHPRANTAVYCFNEDAPVETEIGNDEGVEVYTDDSGIIF
jgi:RecA-family ATPase